MKMALMVGTYECPETAPMGSFGRIFFPNRLQEQKSKNTKFIHFLYRKMYQKEELCF